MACPALCEKKVMQECIWQPNRCLRKVPYTALGKKCGNTTIEWYSFYCFIFVETHTHTHTRTHMHIYMITNLLFSMNTQCRFLYLVIFIFFSGPAQYRSIISLSNGDFWFITGSVLSCQQESMTSFLQSIVNYFLIVFVPIYFYCETMKNNKVPVLRWLLHWFTETRCGPHPILKAAAAVSMFGEQHHLGFCSPAISLCLCILDRY